MNLTAWAIRWNIPLAALHDLQSQMGVRPEDVPTDARRSEAGVQSRVRLEAARKGIHLWRNNVGACYDDQGNFIRYGLANHSKKMNEFIKSSDLIGMRRVVIRPEHVGHAVAQLVAREVKPEGWVYTGTDREVAQKRFIELVLSLGGDAAFVTGEGTL